MRALSWDKIERLKNGEIIPKVKVEIEIAGYIRDLSEYLVDLDRLEIDKRGEYDESALRVREVILSFKDENGEIEEYLRGSVRNVTIKLDLDDEEVEIFNGLVIGDSLVRNKFKVEVKAVGALEYVKDRTLSYYIPHLSHVRPMGVERLLKNIFNQVLGYKPKLYLNNNNTYFLSVLDSPNLAFEDRYTDEGHNILSYLVEYVNGYYEVVYCKNSMGKIRFKLTDNEVDVEELVESTRRVGNTGYRWRLIGKYGGFYYFAVKRGFKTVAIYKADSSLSNTIWPLVCIYEDLSSYLSPDFDEFNVAMDENTGHIYLAYKYVLATGFVGIRIMRWSVGEGWRQYATFSYPQGISQDKITNVIGYADNEEFYLVIGNDNWTWWFKILSGGFQQKADSKYGIPREIGRFVRYNGENYLICVNRGFTNIPVGTTIGVKFLSDVYNIDFGIMAKWVGGGVIASSNYALVDKVVLLNDSGNLVFFDNGIISSHVYCPELMERLRMYMYPLLKLGDDFLVVGKGKLSRGSVDYSNVFWGYLSRRMLKPWVVVTEDNRGASVEDVIKECEALGRCFIDVRNRYEIFVRSTYIRDEEAVYKVSSEVGKIRGEIEYDKMIKVVNLVSGFDSAPVSLGGSNVFKRYIYERSFNFATRGILYVLGNWLIKNYDGRAGFVEVMTPNLINIELLDVIEVEDNVGRVQKGVVVGFKWAYPGIYSLLVRVNCLEVDIDYNLDPPIPSGLILGDFTYKYRRVGYGLNQSIYIDLSFKDLGAKSDKWVLLLRRSSYVDNPEQGNMELYEHEERFEFEFSDVEVMRQVVIRALATEEIVGYIWSEASGGRRSNDLIFYIPPVMDYRVEPKGVSKSGELEIVGIGDSIKGVYIMNPTFIDADGDGMPDGWVVIYSEDGGESWNEGIPSWGNVLYYEHEGIGRMVRVLNSDQNGKLIALLSPQITYNGYNKEIYVGVVGGGEGFGAIFYYGGAEGEMTTWSSLKQCGPNGICMDLVLPTNDVGFVEGYEMRQEVAISFNKIRVGVVVSGDFVDLLEFRILGVRISENGIKISNDLDMRQNKLVNLKSPTDDYDGANKIYVDGVVGNVDQRVDNLEIEVSDINDAIVDLDQRLLVPEARFMTGRILNVVTSLPPCNAENLGMMVIYNYESNYYRYSELRVCMASGENVYSWVVLKQNKWSVGG